MAQLDATEREWQTTVVASDKLMSSGDRTSYTYAPGWWVYHTRDSRGCAPGYPDLVLVRPDDQGGRVVFAELKTDRASSKLSEAQEGWIDLLRDCGQEVYVWRPSDWETVKGASSLRTTLSGRRVERHRRKKARVKD